MATTVRKARLTADSSKKPRARRVVSETLLRQMNPQGNTVLRDFGRILRDEPHKYIYPIRLYLVRDQVAAKDVLDWLRERYISAKGGRNHGARYEVRTYGNTRDKKGDRFVDYILLEKFSEEERVLFSLQFGEVTEDKVERTGKLRRPRLNKAEKVALDKIIDDYYLKVERERRERRD